MGEVPGSSLNLGKDFDFSPNPISILAKFSYIRKIIQVKTVIEKINSIIARLYYEMKLVEPEIPHLLYTTICVLGGTNIILKSNQIFLTV